MSRDIAIERDEAGRPVRLWFGPESTQTPPKAPVRRVGPQGAILEDRQARLDFTPAASELAHAVRGRETNADRLLALMRMGPADTWQMAKAGGLRFSARLQELEARGLRYDREDYGDHSVYTMTQEPRGE